MQICLRTFAKVTNIALRANKPPKGELIRQKEPMFKNVGLKQGGFVSRATLLDTITLLGETLVEQVATMN